MRLPDSTNWLLDRLSVEAVGLISNDRAYAARHGIDGRISLRCIAHHPAGYVRSKYPGSSKYPPYYIMMCVFIVIEMTCDPHPDALVNINIGFINRLRDKVRLRMEQVPLVDVLFVPTLRNAEPEEIVFCVITEDQPNPRLMRAREYAKEINAKRQAPDRRDPIIKPINLAHEDRPRDVFHWWSREFLTGQLAINDLDWIFPVFEEDLKLVLVELKKSSIKEWWPYERDMPNFLLLNAVARALGACKTIIVHFKPEERDVIHVFELLNLAEPNPSARGGRLTLKETSVASQLIQVIKRYQTDTGLRLGWHGPLRRES